MPLKKIWLGARIAPGIIIVVIAAVWWLLTLTGGSGKPMVDSIILPSPAAVWKAGVGLVLAGGILNDAGKTLFRLSCALVLALLAGIPLGLLFGHFREVYRCVEGLLHALRSIPAAALFPLFLIVIGVGESSIIMLAWYNSATVILIGTVSGALLANESRVRQGRMLGMNGWRIATRILFWEALPHIFSSTRVALGYSLALVIAVEMFIGIGEVGLGRKIFDFQAAYRIPETYATILITAGLGVILNAILLTVENYSLRWLPRGQAR